MKLISKRLLVLFSVALNVGFVIMALAMAYRHAMSFEERAWRDLRGLVQRLELPEAQETAVLDTIKRFKVTIDQQDREVKQAREAILLALARTGPVDRDQLRRRIEAVSHQEKLKNDAFEAHVLELRGQLGDEKGAQFFARLREHLKAEKSRPR